jgi:hypothetical protein
MGELFNSYSKDKGLISRLYKELKTKQNKKTPEEQKNKNPINK